jgi:DNA-binding transcriptional MocR family regulator
MVVSLDLSDTSAASRRTAHEYVRDTLRQAILRGSVTGGTRLVQADIAARLGVSTTPVREALRDLATEGLIHLDAHRGAVVRELTYQELIEIYDVHEPARAGGDAPRRARARRDELRRPSALADEMEQEPTSASGRISIGSSTPCSSSPVPNRRLLSTLTALRDTAAPYVGLALQQRGYPLDLANEQHQQLLEAIRAVTTREKVLAIATTTRTWPPARSRTPGTCSSAAAVTEEGPVADALITRRRLSALRAFSSPG